MAKLTDPDQLTTNNFTLNTAAKTFTLVAGQDSLVAKDGVTLQAIYSKFVKLWETSTYNKYPFPMYAIDALSGQFQFGTDGATYSGWAPANDTTRQMIRDGGWSEYTSGGVLFKQFVGIVSLGAVNSGAQLYYQKASGGAAADFTFDDAVNEGILVYEQGVSDTRTFFKGYVREYAKKYKDSILADTGKTATGAYIVNVLLSNEDDLDIVDTDADVITTPISPYSEMSLKYFSGAYSKDVDLVGTARNFGIVVDVGTHSGIDGSMSASGSTLTSAIGGIAGADYTGGTLKVHEGTNKGTYPISGTPSGTVVTITGTFAATESSASFTLQRAAPAVATLQEIYTWVQAKLRQATDIDDTAGTVTGKTASLLLNFVGPSLKCGFFAPTNPNGGGSGVMIEGLAAADINSVVFYDNTAASREYPYASAGVMNFNSFLTAGGTGYYRMYFVDPTVASSTDEWGDADAVTVNDADGNPIAGAITAGTKDFTFDYTGNAQHDDPGQPVDIVVVAGNPGHGKPVVAWGTITQSKAIVVTLTAEQDRAYVD